MKETDFKKFLDDESWNYKQDTIQQMMEKELEKEPEDINMEFVDACMKYLTGYSEDKASVNDNKSSHKRINFKRLLIAAVIIVLTLSIGITAYARANEMRISDVLVDIFSDHATVDYSEKDNAELDADVPYDSTKLYKELKEGGIEDIMLPLDLYYAEYERLDWFNDFTEYSVGFVADTGNHRMSIDIETYTDKKWITNPDIMGEFTASKKIEVNGIDVYLFEIDGDKPRKVKTSISYQIGLTQYFINCYYNIDEAEQFVKTMK